MKRIASLTLLIVALTGLAFAKQKPTYDLTGTVAYESFNSDSEAHVVVNGEHFDAYCSETGNSVDCTDTPGIVIATLADGSKTVVGLPNLMWSRSNDNPVNHSKTFQYRLKTFGILGPKVPTFCVMGSDSKEACYDIQRPLGGE